LSCSPASAPANEAAALVCWELEVVLEALDVNCDARLVPVAHVIVVVAGTEAVSSGEAQTVIEVLLHVLI